MNAHDGPPERGRPGPTPGTGPTKSEIAKPTNQVAAYSTVARQRGAYACAWRHGFAFGFRDALRLAARRLPPETWHTLDRLADE
ncbi:MAG TPA: hypothetical protein VLL82_17050 [Mycobacterium sp.]|jgi:hypothetical protein|nr:hypothetical protein [Mycobacterium sp.]